MHLLAVVVAAGVCGVLGALAPVLIARIPEPAVKEDERPADDGQSGARRSLPAPPPKELYADLAVRPRLRLGATLASGATGAVCGWAVGWTGALVVLCFLVPVGVVLAVVDWRTTLLPTWVIAPSYAVVLALVLVAAALDRDGHAAIRSGFGWLVWGGLFFVLWFVHPRGMGYGDVRLSGLLGLALGYVGWPACVIGLWLAFVLGGVGGLLLSLLRIVERKRFPFGPFMLVGAVAGLVAGALLTGGLAP